MRHLWSSKYLLRIIYLDDDSKIFRGFQTADEALNWATSNRDALRLTQCDWWSVNRDLCPALLPE